jgi:hypothetical protein
MGVDDATRRLLLGAVVPMWAAAGVVDWWCHRRSNIEKTTGPRESLLHLAMAAEAGVPVTLGLLCEVNGGVLLTSYLALAAHQATSAVDVSFAAPRRQISPLEQHTHGVLEQAPVMATAMLTALHWDQALALFGFGEQQLGMRLRLRPSLPGPAVAALVIGLGLVVVGPLVEEFVRCLARRRSEAELSAEPPWRVQRASHHPAHEEEHG